jgi:ubiquinone/menaquinone biosynthesis C-methylase UbiE
MLREFMELSLVKFYYNQFGNAKKILDLGCGPGDMGRFKPDSSIQIFGLDKSKRLISTAKRYYEEISVFDLDENALPFDDNFFDAILAKDILEHLNAPLKIAVEMYRVLCSGGIALAQVPMAKPKVVWGDYTHIRGFTREALKKLFEDCGFETIAVYKMGGVPLAGRLDMTRFVPTLLKIPLFDHLFGSSYLIKIKKT